MSEKPSDGKRLFEVLWEFAHPGLVMIYSAALRRALQAAILSKMRPLSNNFKTRLFDGYGPIASFSAQIDLAYALGLIDKDIFDELKVIKEIRNEFAHATRVLNFSSPGIIELCKRFKKYKKGEKLIF